MISEAQSLFLSRVMRWSSVFAAGADLWFIQTPEDLMNPERLYWYSIYLTLMNFTQSSWFIRIIRIWKQQRNGYFFQTSFMIMLLLLKHKFLQFRTWWHLWVLRDKILIKLFNYIYIYILYWACYRHFSVDNEAHVHENIQITLSNFICQTHIWSNILNVI